MTHLGHLFARFTATAACTGFMALSVFAQKPLTNDLSVLIERLGDPDPEVRRAVARAFEKNPELTVELDAVNELAELASSDPNESVKLQALAALSKVPEDEIFFYPDVIDTLERLAGGEGGAATSSAAQKVLVELGAALPRVDVLKEASSEQSEKAPTSREAGISSLVLKLRNSDEVDEQCLAATRLSHFQGAAKEAVPTLVRFIKHRKGKLHDCALAALRRIDPAAEPERLRHLMRQLEDEDIRVRIETLMVLEGMGPAASKAFDSVMSRVEKGDRREIPFAMDTAAAILDTPKQHEMLVDAVMAGIESPALHPSIARAMGKMGDDGARTLIKALEDDDPRRRLMAARIVFLLSEPAPSLMRAAKQRLAKEDRHDVWTQILASTERFESLTLEEIKELLKSETNPEFRESLVFVLPRFGVEALPLLAQALEDRRTEVKLAALESLAELGTQAGPAIESIVALDDPSLADAMGEALAGIGPQALPTVLEAATSHVRTRQKAAVIALGTYAASDSTALAELTAMLETADRDLKEHIIRNLGRAGPAAEPAVPHLLRVFDSRDQWLGLTAISSLGEIGQGATPAVGSIVSILRATASKELKNACVTTLGKIAPYDDKALSEVIRVATKDPSLVLRVQAVQALGNLKGNTEKAVRALRRILEEKNSQLRSEAAKSLLKIGGAEDILVAYSVVKKART